jgi:hypothetical protein
LSPLLTKRLFEILLAKKITKNCFSGREEHYSSNRLSQPGNIPAGWRGGFLFVIFLQIKKTSQLASGRMKTKKAESLRLPLYADLLIWIQCSYCPRLQWLDFQPSFTWRFLWKRATP